MEYDGKIVRVFKAEEGVGKQSGNAWKVLPFVFEFYDEDNKQWPQRKILRTFNLDYQRMIAPYIQRNADKTPVLIANDELAMVAPMPVHIGFTFNVRDGQRQDGTTYHVEDSRIYKFEPVTAAAAVNAPQAQQPPIQPAQAYQPAPAAPQAPAPLSENEDLPF